MKNLTRLCAIACAGLIACASSISTGKPAEPSRPSAPATTDASKLAEQMIQQALSKAPPGSTVRIGWGVEDQGASSHRSTGDSKGIGAQVTGDKLNENTNLGAPVVSAGEDGSDATGGDTARRLSGSAIRLPPLPWANPMFWIGILMLSGSGWCVYRMLRRAAAILGLLGVAFIAGAWYPWVFLVITAGGCAVLAYMYVFAEHKNQAASKEAKTDYEALRGVMAAVHAPDLSDAEREKLVNLIRRESDLADLARMAQVEKDDGLTTKPIA